MIRTRSSDFSGFKLFFYSSGIWILKMPWRWALGWLSVAWHAFKRGVKYFKKCFNWGCARWLRLLTEWIWSGISIFTTDSKVSKENLCLSNETLRWSIRRSNELCSSPRPNRNVNSNGRDESVWIKRGAPEWRWKLTSECLWNSGRENGDRELHISFPCVILKHLFCLTMHEIKFLWSTFPSQKIISSPWRVKEYLARFMKFVVFHRKSSLSKEGRKKAAFQIMGKCENEASLADAMWI